MSNTDVWKVAGAQSEESPTGYIHWRKFKLMCQVFVFSFQLQIIFITISIGKDPGLSEEKGFHLEKIIAMLVYIAEIDMLRPCFKGIAIQAETEISGQSHKKSIFPMAVMEP